MSEEWTSLQAWATPGPGKSQAWRGTWRGGFKEIPEGAKEQRLGGSSPSWARIASAFFAG